MHVFISEFVLCFVDISIKSMDISNQEHVLLFCFVGINNMFFYCWYQELLLIIFQLVSRAFIAFIDKLSTEFFIGIKSKNMFILSLYFQLVFKNMFILKRGRSNLF